MTHRLVTFLGRGRSRGATPYEETEYRYGNHALRTPWVAEALMRFFDPGEIIVVATDEAWNHRPEGAAKANGEALAEALDRCVHREQIPNGSNEEELWQQFQTLKSVLRGAKHVILDITHAFRNQPFFASAVIGFLRHVEPSPPSFRVVYGNFELSRQLGYSPIFNLTLFTDVLDWTHDITLFLKTGRVTGLASRTEALGRELSKAWADAGKQGERPRLRELAEAIGAFARNLQTIRTGALLLGNGKDPSSARRLLEAAEQARSDVELHLPPLADVLGRIEEMARPLVFEGDALVGPKAKQVLANLADLYLDMGRYVEAITTLREGRITAFAAPAAACPGDPRFDEGERDFAEKRFWHEAEHEHATSIAKIRNDIDHGGYRAGPLSADRLIANIKDERQKFEKMTFTPTPHAERVFANITNHPSTDWPEPQRQSALALAGHIHDLPFPDVRPEWVENRIDREAEKIVSSLPPETTHALVQGEFTLTMALVRKLQARGIRCLAATTERRIEKTADGRELRQFRFVRFRGYPKLA